MSDELTIREVAEILGISQQTVRNAAASGHLAVRLTPGGHRRFDADDVAAYRAQRLIGEGAGLEARAAAWCAAADQLLRAAERDLREDKLRAAAFRIARQEISRRLDDLGAPPDE